MRVSQPLRALCFSLSRYRLNRLTLLAISNYSNKTATPSPVMFWTVKAPFWYTLVAPRPEETARPLRRGLGGGGGELWIQQPAHLRRSHPSESLNGRLCRARTRVRARGL